MWGWVTTAWEGIKSLFGGKGGLQIGSGNRSSNVTIGDNAQNVIVGDLMSITPVLPKPSQPQLSVFAKQILLDATDHADGKIYFGHTMFGHNLHAGRTEITNCEDARKVAEMEAALQDLLDRGAVEAYGSVGYKITHRGYDLATSLKSPSSS
jgi:hypothetical protein